MVRWFLLANLSFSRMAVLVILAGSLLVPGTPVNGKEIIVLTAGAPAHTVSAGSDAVVYGTAADNHITLGAGAKAELVNFPGNNTIVFASGQANFQVSRSGSVVTFAGSDGTVCSMPATAFVQTISFGGGTSLELRIQDNRVTLAGLTVTAENADIPDSGDIPDAGTFRIQPGDLEYRGAFRLPGPSGGSDWDYSGTALTWYPSGDPDGAADGYPGSLFGAGHVHQMQVSEISIPEPVLAKDPALLNTARTLQPFSDITAGMFDMQALEIPALGLAYLPGQDGTGEESIAFCVGQHFQGFEVSHGLAGADLGSPAPSGPWFFGGFTNYVSNDYLTAVPKAWAARFAPGMVLASGRFREGVWGGLGPALFAYTPYDETGSLPTASTALSRVVPLLLYGTQLPGASDIVSDPSQKMVHYQESDHWTGAAWLTAGTRSALIFSGTKAAGRSWYGFANGVEWPYDCAEQTPPTCPDVPDWPYDNRGYWADSYQAWILFYDPEDLGAAASGDVETWEPQPYAYLDITPVLFDPALNHAEYKRDLLGAAAFDDENGILYIVERLADEYRSVIHVWQIR